MQYSDFEAEDFIRDPFFQKWILDTDDMVDAFWKAWLKDHPEKTSQVEEAVQIVKAFKFKHRSLSTEDFNELWKDIIADRGTGNYRLGKPSTRVPVLWTGAAAAILVLLVTGYLFFIQGYFGSNTVQWHTNYGEKKEIILPDSSTVILNANSKLSYSKNWGGSEARMVELMGEAFFSVVHLENDQKFIVRSSDVNIEVLGTAFNVNSRRGNSKVILNEGSVRLDLSGIDWEVQSQPGDSYLLMEPGEMVEVNKDEKEISKKIVDPTVYSSWTKNILIFDKTPLEEVISMIEDNYGYAVYTDNLNVEDLDFTGELYSSELDLILEYLSETFDLHVKKENKKIILIKNN